MQLRRTDALIGVAGSVVAVAIAAFEANVAGQGAMSTVTTIVLGLLLAAARPYPRATWAVAAAVLAITVNGTFALGDGFALDMLVAAHAFLAGRWDGWSRGLGGPIALIAAGALNAAVAHGGAGFFLFIVPAAWGAGHVLREREQLSARLAERAHELEQEREAYAQLSVRYERARIASELHDIVAHAISVMVVQASAGQRLATVDAEATAEAFDAIAVAARQAEEDMQRLVALLGDEEAIGPAPDLELVTELVARAAGSGLQVTLTLEGEREGLPAPIVQTVYRVVQEGLTNALRYASGAAVAVVIRGDTQGLFVEVVNGKATGDAGPTGLGSGHGLGGLRERVGACGGTLEAGPTIDDGWRLCAHLPRQVPATTPAAGGPLGDQQRANRR
jgi:signal transduction histidine kinase